MTELMVDYITSLDGFGAAEGWPGLWGMGGPEYFGWLGEDAEQEYRLIMGAATYRLFAGMSESGAEGIGDLTARPNSSSPKASPARPHGTTRPWSNKTPSRRCGS